MVQERIIPSSISKKDLFHGKFKEKFKSKERKFLIVEEVYSRISLHHEVDYHPP